MQFYPPQLYKAPGSPLYFLQQIKDFYIAAYNDPLVQPETEPNWMHLVSVVEIAFQLPTALYAAWRLSGSKGTSGPFELLLLVYAFETAFSTLLCINDVFYWDPAVYSPEQKNVFLFQLYGAWLVIRKSHVQGQELSKARLTLFGSRVDVFGHVLEAVQPALGDRRCEEDAVELGIFFLLPQWSSHDPSLIYGPLESSGIGCGINVSCDPNRDPSIYNRTLNILAVRQYKL